jgi:hypothetical protein
VGAVGILAVVVGLSLLGQFGALLRSNAAALSAAFAATCGLVAGVMGAAQRRKDNWPAAGTAYRVAMWCFVLTCFQLATYQAALDTEKAERVQRALEEYQQTHPEDR